MGISRITLLLSLGTSLLASDSVSEMLEAPRPKSEASATVTVTAEAGTIELVKTPNPVRVIDKIALEQSGARTLGDLLEDLLPGQVINNGGVGTSASVLLGGARNQDVLITLDGIRLTDASGLGGANPNALSLAGIERIEIQSGPCSSQFGADAMGGAISLFTAGAPSKGVSGELSETVGTQGIAALRANTAFGWGTGWVRGALTGKREDQATDTPHPYRNTGVFLGFGQELAQDHLVTVSYRNAYTGVPTPYASISQTSRTYAPDREARNRNEEIIGSLHSTLGPEWSTELSLGHVIQDRLEPGYTTPFSSYRSRENQAVAKAIWSRAQTRVSLGADACEEFAQTPGLSAPDTGEGRHLGLHLEGSWEPLEWLRLLGTLRQQWDRQNYRSEGLPTASNEAESNHLTWKLGTNVLLGESFRAYASSGTAFGLPLLSAVVYNATQAATVPLDREESTFTNLGLTWASGNWSAKLEASRTRFKRLVYFDLNHYLYANGSHLQTQGLEGTFGYQTASWGVNGYYRNQEARDMDVPLESQLSSPAVVRRPFNSLGLKAFVTLADFRLDARWGWFGPHYENFGGYPTVLGASKVHFNDLAVGLAWAPSKAVSLALRGEHLLQPKVSVADWTNLTMDGRNDAYQIFGFPAQPPTWTLEARYRF